MKRALIIASGLFVVILVFLWKLAASPASDDVPASQPIAKVEPPPPPVIEKVEKHVEAGSAAAPVDPDKPEKLKISSDAFFYKWSEMVTPKLSRLAIRCVEKSPKDGHLMRYQNAVLTYDIAIKDGTVTVSNVKMEKSTMDDNDIDECFKNEILHATWHDDSLPDLEEHRRIKLSPGRGMKKYRQDNINYVGKELSAPTK